MNDYEQLLEDVPELKERIPEVSKQLSDMIVTQFSNAFRGIDKQMQDIIGELEDNLELNDRDRELLKNCITADAKKINSNMKSTLTELIKMFEM